MSPMNPANYIFTKHAEVRIRQREISPEEIISTIKQPDSRQSSFLGRLVVRKKFPKETLEVVYRKLGTKIIVITCYWIK